MVTYIAPKPFPVISIDEGTLKRVFRENVKIRQDLKLLKSGLDDTEQYVTKMLGKIKELKVPGIQRRKTLPSQRNQ